MRSGGRAWLRVRNSASSLQAGSASISQCRRTLDGDGDGDGGHRNDWRESVSISNPPSKDIVRHDRNRILLP